MLMRLWRKSVSGNVVCGLGTSALALTLASCATTGATLGSGVGDAFLEHPPFYAGARSVPPGETGHLPVVYQPGATQPAIFDPSLSDSMNELLAAMTAYLDSLGVSRRLVEGGRVSAVSRAETRTGPDVRFGCVGASALPDDDCAEPGDGAMGRGRQQMKLAVGRPSPEWTTWAAQVMADQGVERMLVITLETSVYLIRQRGLLGRKEVELGTGHTARLPWLTSLETPVSVIQLTGALIGPDGKAIRIGTEGLVARRTPLMASSFHMQALISDADVTNLLAARRDDLSGRPLVWQEGLRNLVHGLLGRLPA